MLRRSFLSRLSAAAPLLGVKQTGATPEAVRTELTANLIGNAQIVPAGIVAVTRAQERGYLLVSIG